MKESSDSISAGADDDEILSVAEAISNIVDDIKEIEEMTAQALNDALETNEFILTLAQAEQDRIDEEQAALQQRAEALAGFSCP